MEFEMNAFNIGLYSMGLFFLKMLLMLFMGIDDEGDFESDGIYVLFSINKVLSFFMGFGFAQHELNAYYFSIPIGIAFGVFYHFVMKKVRRMSDNVDVPDVLPEIGEAVKVYTRITPVSGTVIWNGREMNARACSEDEELGINTLVKIKSIDPIDKKTLFVEIF